MRKFVKIPLIAIFGAMLFASCSNDDGYDLGTQIIRWGTVVGEQQNYSIRCDDGSMLHVSATLVPHYRVEDGQRIIVNYTPLDDASDGWYIRLNNFLSVLTKEPISKSFMAEDIEREDSIGTDKIDVEAAGFGWNYINIRFGMRYGSLSEPHMINLVWDDTNADPTTENPLELTLRHNAKGDSQAYYGYGYVSFDLSGIVPAGKTSVPVKLKWTGYDGNEHNKDGVFTLKGVSSANILSGQQGAEANNIIE